MARSYANIATAIWRDEDFRLLDVAEQHAYFLLISQPDISAAGVLSLNLNRWAARTKGVTRASLRVALEGLEVSRFIAFDDETEELLVRSFVRWDNGYTNPKRRPVIRDAAAEVESVALRRVLAEEFDRLGLPSEWLPDAHADAVSDRHPDSLSAPESPSRDAVESSQENRLSDSPSDGVSPSERVVVSTCSPLDPPTHNPQSTTPFRAHSAAADKPAKRATRIPDDFAVTAEMVAWARKNTPGIDGAYETSKFRDYWHGVSGAKGTKQDWPSTWRNWMRKAQEDLGRSRRGPATGDNRHTNQRHDNPFAED